ncbi:LysR family transcriptional regulator [Rhizobium rhizogenes]|uniref:LysR family transcriptional regulator n=1 Tax=Rhizobium rhizogenes NBRC 13257 TaxID=1220581 RepID=A0AA87UCA4_RHIRH|nr:LysR family transcriptional regulator [Rhizobium rhizogenes]NTG71496.1 LysR family transcriptional regulator [Rhizobium rhizogenes]NTG90592.1 LysR family transcriptional regulator [Rhizobium rhizogenes]TRB03415.1 LysR family transcriptional regulator [Rhizobium rhizogenes]TRB38157.1 LysR family transcriptional regulator [Rhizobium rhizogenes]TRB53168.1 LysR family transcriptional regulator [Rhizobium rhizogenes]
MIEIHEEQGIGLRRAQIFREIIRSGSTRRASRVLQITQSAVSQHLKQFEELVGEKLFVRDHRGLIPTTRAIEIYSRIDRYFETLGHIEREILGSFAVARNSLSIAAPHLVCLSLLPKLVAEFERIDPSLEFYIRAQGYDQIAQHVLTGEADIGISRLPLDERFFEWRTICESKSVCLVNPEHPLANKERITAEDTSSERMITLDREFSSNTLALKGLSYKGRSPTVKVRTDAIGFAAAFAAHGSGVTIVNEFIARQCEMFDLKVVPFHPPVNYEYVIFWRRGSDKMTRQASFIEAVVEFTKQYMLGFAGHSLA